MNIAKFFLTILAAVYFLSLTACSKHKDDEAKGAGPRAQSEDKIFKDGFDSKRLTKPDSNPEPKPVPTPEPTPTPAPQPDPIVVPPKTETPAEVTDADVQEQVDKILRAEKDDPFPEINRTNNQQLNILIEEVSFEFNPDKPDSAPELSFKTHSDARYDLDFLARRGNVYTYVYRAANSASNKDLKSTLFKAEVEVFHFNNKIMADIQITDVQTTGRIHVIYLRKKGLITINDTVTPPEQKALLTGKARGAGAFLKYTKENPDVVGEFYYVVTDQMTLTTQFRLMMSSTYILSIEGSTALTYTLNNPDFNSVPLKHDNIGGMFHDMSFIQIDSSEYAILSRKNPILLKQMTLNLKLKGVTPNPKDDIPTQFILNF